MVNSYDYVFALWFVGDAAWMLTNDLTWIHQTKFVSNEKCCICFRRYFLSLCLHCKVKNMNRFQQSEKELFFSIEKKSNKMEQRVLDTWSLKCVSEWLYCTIMINDDQYEFICWLNHASKCKIPYVIA